MIIKETTAVSISVIALFFTAISGMMLWLTAIYTTIETSKADIGQLKLMQQHLNTVKKNEIKILRETHLELKKSLDNINLRLARIEGKINKD